MKQSQLARDLQVTSTTIGRYMKQLDADTIDERTWAQIAGVLSSRYGITTESVRPVRQSALSVDATLTPYLDVFKADGHLAALVDILEGTQGARDLLLFLARDRLGRR